MTPLASTSAVSVSEPGRGMSRPWLYAILVGAFLFVLMPFLFWESTWFGRRLTDKEIGKQLTDREHPRKAQHALSQIADRMVSRDPLLRASARQWYPQVAAMAAGEVDELRLTVAWVMGQDKTAPEFHSALLRLVADPQLMVRRNAALSLVRFGDSTGRPIIVSMLDAYALRVPAAGALSERLKPGEVVNPGTLLGRVRKEHSEVEIRSQVPGVLERWVANDGARVAEGEAIGLISPSRDVVWEALRGLYLIGLPEDLPAIERYTRPVGGLPEAVRSQALRTATAIRRCPLPETREECLKADPQR